MVEMRFPQFAVTSRREAGQGQFQAGQQSGFLSIGSGGGACRRNGGGGRFLWRHETGQQQQTPRILIQPLCKAAEGFRRAGIALRQFTNRRGRKSCQPFGLPERQALAIYAMPQQNIVDGFFKVGSGAGHCSLTSSVYLPIIFRLGGRRDEN
jgi:hypothetical protein